MMNIGCVPDMGRQPTFVSLCFLNTGKGHLKGCWNARDRAISVYQVMQCLRDEGQGVSSQTSIGCCLREALGIDAGYFPPWDNDSEAVMLI